MSNIKNIEDFKKSRKHRFIITNILRYSLIFLFFRTIFALINGTMGTVWAEILSTSLIFGVLIAIFRAFKVKNVYLKAEDFAALNTILISNGYDAPRKFSETKLVYIKKEATILKGVEEVIVETMDDTLEVLATKDIIKVLEKELNLL